MTRPEAERMDGICRFRFEMGAECRITHCVKMPGLPPAARTCTTPPTSTTRAASGSSSHIKGQRSHAIVEQALQVLINLLHRGACGCEANTGDGAGILIQMPDRFLRRKPPRLGFALPPERRLRRGPRLPAARSARCARESRRRFERDRRRGRAARARLARRADRRLVGRAAARSRSSRVFQQLFIGRGAGVRRGRSTAPTTTSGSSASST